MKGGHHEHSATGCVRRGMHLSSLDCRRARLTQKKMMITLRHPQAP